VKRRTFQLYKAMTFYWPVWLFLQIRLQLQL